jgi:uncharacterized protein related to proFAR isomerase
MDNSVLFREALVILRDMGASLPEIRTTLKVSNEEIGTTEVWDILDNTVMLRCQRILDIKGALLYRLNDDDSILDYMNSASMDYKYNGVEPLKYMSMCSYEELKNMFTYLKDLV